MPKTYNTAKCEDEARKASQAFTKFMNTTYDDAPGFREQACKLNKARQDAEYVYGLALAEDYHIQQELDYAMMIEVARICMEAHQWIKPHNAAEAARRVLYDADGPLIG